MGDGVLPSVCSFVRSSVACLNLTRERKGPGSPRLAGWKSMSNPLIYLKVKRSKVKVTRRINAHAVNAQYLQNGKACELQAWCTDVARRPKSPTSAVTSKSKVKVTRSRDASDRYWPTIYRWTTKTRIFSYGRRLEHVATQLV